jgi:hypothetical protein
MELSNYVFRGAAYFFFIGYQNSAPLGGFSS